MEKITSSDNLSYDLFSKVLSPNVEQKDNFSNLLLLWDTVTKYCVSKAMQNKMRTKDTHELPVFETSFVSLDGDKCTLSIKPARIEKNGVMIDFYPSETEELIEAALSKIFLQQQYAIHKEGKHINHAHDFLKSWPLRQSEY